MKTVTLQNDRLTVTISTKGAEITSVKASNGEECIWQGDPKFWPSQTPMLFPIVGGLKEDKFIYRGQEYHLQKHGFTRNAPFTLESAEADSATFLLCSTMETQIGYPFRFELRILYRLVGNAVEVKYLIDNKTNDDMYFSIGAHEGYACPEGIQDYYLEFDEKETADAIDLNGNLLTDHATPILKDSNRLDLNYAYFSVDALIFKGMKSRGVCLKSKNSSRCIRVEYPGFDYIGIWTKVGAPYLCIEPWCGLPDYESHNFELTQKEGIIRLEPNGSAERMHTLTFTF